MAGWRIARVALVLAALAPWLGACRSSPASIVPGDADNPIAPEFKSFWEEAGGLATFGPPLEPPQRVGTGLSQTFLAVQLVVDESDRDQPVRLAALGLDLGLAEPAEPPSDAGRGRYFAETGHTLYAGFAPFYEALGGQEVVGPPITEVRFSGGRISQYFENLGMVRPENASPSDVRLVALGLAVLPSSAFGLDVDKLVLPGSVRERPFSAALDEYGGEALLGQPLSDPYLAEDGVLEQVYERAVVYDAGNDARRVGFRAIGRELGASAPAAPRSDEPGAIFDEATGHNILWAFADFYRAHRGPELLGAPLDEARLENDRLVQWFENGELVYSYDLPVDLVIELAPLGARFFAAHPLPSPSATGESRATATITVTPSSVGGITIEVTLGKVSLRASDEQTVAVRLLGRDGKPLKAVSPTVTWYGPTSSDSIQAPATDKRGRTSVSFRLEGARPFQIITVVVTARDGSQYGEALAQFAIAWSPAP
ncbi:MAG TPA: hypothetical protein VLD63_09665 [Anaerolineales bacterium]|nr:hypothetical protein [Anaerolineales bacterium]